MDEDGWIDARDQLHAPKFKVVDLDTGHIPKVVRCNLTTGEWLAYKQDDAGNLQPNPLHPGMVMMHQGKGRLTLVPLDEADVPTLVGPPNAKEWV